MDGTIMVVNDIRIETDEVSLGGTLTVPDMPKGIVLFSYCRGSSRHSPRDRLEWLPCRKELVIVPQATRLFEEPGKLDEVARLAADWFAGYLH
jgi:hypothetical protein